MVTLIVTISANGAEYISEPLNFKDGSKGILALNIYDYSNYKSYLRTIDSNSGSVICEDALKSHWESRGNEVILWQLGIAQPYPCNRTKFCLKLNVDKKQIQMIPVGDGTVVPTPNVPLCD